MIWLPGRGLVMVAGAAARFFVCSLANSDDGVGGHGRHSAYWNATSGQFCSNKLLREA